MVDGFLDFRSVGHPTFVVNSFGSISKGQESDGDHREQSVSRVDSERTKVIHFQSRYLFLSMTIISSSQESL